MGKRIRIGLVAGAAAMLAVLPVAPAAAQPADPECRIVAPFWVSSIQECAEYFLWVGSGDHCETSGGYIGDQIMWCVQRAWDEIREP